MLEECRLEAKDHVDPLVVLLHCSLRPMRLATSVENCAPPPPHPDGYNTSDR